MLKIINCYLIICFDWSLESLNTDIDLHQVWSGVKVIWTRLISHLRCYRDSEAPTEKR